MSAELKPIPAELLTDSAELLTPTDSGYDSEELENVRIIRTGAMTDYAAGYARENTQITMYFDCVNSLPADAEFSVGQLIAYNEEKYEITKTELFAGESPHHRKITARKVNGEENGIQTSI